MIICLYESYRPPGQVDEPHWKDLPLGYFQFDLWRKWHMEITDRMTLPGVCVFAGNKGTVQPKKDEHLLAAFSYQEIRYLYHVTLTHEYEDLGQCEVWRASLELFRLIRIW